MNIIFYHLDTNFPPLADFQPLIFNYNFAAPRVCLGSINLFFKFFHYHPTDFKITIKTSINTMLYIRFSGKQYLIFKF
ncbi:MAG: hypothetical protein DRI44_03950 [Chlamydiae bacterium]|nr:MAG: hypothetical protein DRI44_03950 [Chlamydiota bacterium]